VTTAIRSLIAEALRELGIFPDDIQPSGCLVYVELSAKPSRELLQRFARVLEEKLGDAECLVESDVAVQCIGRSVSRRTSCLMLEILTKKI